MLNQRRSQIKHKLAKIPLLKHIYYLGKNISFLTKYHITDIACLYDVADSTINLEDFFSKVRQIWDQKDITLIANKHIFEGLQYNIFDNARSVEIMDAPRENAFAEYDTLLKRALKIDKNRLILIILGQTATVLAYDLAQNGLRALDFGHLAKTYDWYKCNKLSDIKNFFKPD